MALTYVGGTSGTGTSNGYTVSLSGTLTGGSDSSPSAGDVVVVFSAFGNTASSAPNVSGNTSGAFQPATAAQHVNDTWDTEFRSFYQVMGSTPDTTLTITRTTNTAYGGATTVQVWRGVDTSSPFVGAATPASGGNGAAMNPPAYDPAVADAVIIAGGAGTMPSAGTSGYTSISGMSNAVVAYGNGSTADISVIMASFAYAGSSYDPATATGGTQNNTSSSWAGVTLAIRALDLTQTLTPTLYDDVDAFGAATVGLAYPATFDNGIFDTGIFDTVAIAGGTQTLTATIYADADSFGAHTVTAGAVTLTATIYTNTSTFGAHTVTPGAVTLSPTLFADADSFGAATVNHGLIATKYTNVSTFGSHTVTPGTVTLTATLYADPDTFGAATIVPGAVTLSPTLYVDPDSFGAHTVTLGGGGAQNLTATLFVDADSFGAHTVTPGAVTLTATRYADPDTFGAATVSHGLIATRFDNVSTFGAATVTPGPVTLVATRFDDPDSFGAAVVVGGLVFGYPRDALPDRADLGARQSLAGRGVLAGRAALPLRRVG